MGWSVLVGCCRKSKIEKMFEKENVSILSRHEGGWMEFLTIALILALILDLALALVLST